MKKSTIITVLSVLFILAGVIAAYIISVRVPRNPESAAGNTLGNLNSGGMFCESDGKIYFSNPYDGYTLYSMNTDCSDVKKLSSDRCSYINAYGKFIYYIKNNITSSSSLLSGSPYGVIRCRKNGSHYEVLHGDYSDDLALSGNTLVFNSPYDGSMATFSVNINGSDSRQLATGDFSNAGLTENGLYYSNPGVIIPGNHYIYRMNVSDGSSYPVLEANTYMANYIDGILYYIDLDNGYALTSYYTQTGQSRVITSEHVVLYNVYEGVIYYQEETGEHSVVRIGSDGSNPVRLMAGDVSSISCTSQYTFVCPYGEDSVYVTPTFTGTGFSKMIID